MFVLHLQGLGSVTFMVVMARWEQLPHTAAGHLQDFIDGFVAHGLLVAGVLQGSIAEGGQGHQLLSPHH